MSVTRARWLFFGLLGLAMVMALIALACDGVMVPVLGITGLVVLVAAGIVQLLFHRCPHCDRFLDRNFWGEHCQYCGNSLMEDKP